MANGAPISENQILRLRDPAENDENNWATFDLRSVEVVDKKGKLVNLLHADANHPVTVTGTLQVSKGNAGLLLPTATRLKNAIVQVKNVTHFAYGAYANGDVDFWAAGLAGWHCIKPADNYTAIFHDMIEAVHIFYFIADSYGSQQRPRWDELFENVSFELDLSLWEEIDQEQYARIHHITSEAAAEKIYSHGQFLASRMMKGDEGIKWGHTSFYQHLRKVQPTSFGLIAPTPPPTKPAPAQTVPTRIASSRAAPAPTATSRPAQSRLTSLRATKPNSMARFSGTNPSRSSRRSRITEAEELAATRLRETRNSQHRGPLLSEVNKSKARDLWKFMQKTVNNSRPSAAEVTLDSIAHSIVQFYTVEDENRATEYLQVLAADLVPLMQAKRQRQYDWPNLPIYEDLIESKPTAAAKRRVAATELELRAHPLSDEEDEDEESALSESSEEEVLDETDHRTMSVLRPKSGTKFSGKAASRKGKGKAPQIGDSEPPDEDTEVMDVDTPSKRKSMSEDEEEEESYPRKRFTRSQGDHDQELEDLEFEAQQAKSTGLPLRKKAQSNGVKPNVPAPVVISEPIFTTRAQEPGDVWTCPREGCLHKVYGASDNGALIKEHHLEHDEVFNLVRSEENRTNLPVSALLKRIREMAESQHGPRLGQMGMGGDTSPMTTVFPAPIVRRV
ncbi:hypothetical protein E2P81_ATG05755 [Venturia nashicola]|nr:hypothetical protein E2P81_ATG05755 [Venturia nashicola]